VPPRPFYRRLRFQVAAAAAIVLMIVLGTVYYVYASRRESTNDAFIEGRIVRVSPQVPGQIARLLVNDNERVQRGQLLVQIDDRDFAARADQARAQATAADVAARNAQDDARRAEQLFARQLIARADEERAVAMARQRVADAEAARKLLAQAELALSFTRIVAPDTGRITRRMVEQGAFVQVGQTLMSIVPDDFWVIANFKETQLEKMRPGQSADVKVDAYPGLTFHGHVDSIQSGTGARFSLLPPENATGNYVKVVQRVPVKIVLDHYPPGDYQLGPGMSVVPTVHVR
jgi:membrane fusion protein (multidrug efflux system)